MKKVVGAEQKGFHLLNRNKKVVSVLLTFFFVFSVFSPTAFAAQTYSNALTATNLEYMSVSQSVVDSSVESRNAVTKIIKTAIEFIKDNKHAAADVIEQVAGSDVAEAFLKYYDKVVEALDPLLAWSEIPAQAVYDAVRRVLVGAGVNETTAVQIALAIKEGLSWFI